MDLRDSILNPVESDLVRTSTARALFILMWANSMHTEIAMLLPSKYAGNQLHVCIVDSTMLTLKYDQ